MCKSKEEFNIILSTIVDEKVILLQGAKMKIKFIVGKQKKEMCKQRKKFILMKMLDNRKLTGGY